MIKNSHKIRFLYILLVLEFLLGLGLLLIFHDGTTDFLIFIVFFVAIVVTIRILMHFQYYEQLEKEKSQEEALRQAMAVESAMTGLLR